MYSETVQGQVKATARNGYGFCVDDVWYNIQDKSQMPPYKSQVSFNPVYGDDGKVYAENIQVQQSQQAPRGQGFSPGGRKFAGKGGGGKYDNVGQQVGNALTNAVSLYVHGKLDASADSSIYETIGRAATQLARTADRVRAALEKPVTGPPAAPAAPNYAPQPQPQQGFPQPPAAPQAQRAPVQHAPAPQADFDDDIPW